VDFIEALSSLLRLLLPEAIVPICGPSVYIEIHVEFTDHWYWCQQKSLLSTAIGKSTAQPGLNHDAAGERNLGHDIWSRFVINSYQHETLFRIKEFDALVGKRQR
jgi:hypothetical protein